MLWPHVNGLAHSMHRDTAVPSSPSPQPVAQQAARAIQKKEPAGVFVGRASLGLDSLILAMWGSL